MPFLDIFLTYSLLGFWNPARSVILGTWHFLVMVTDVIFEGDDKEKEKRGDRENDNGCDERLKKKKKKRTIRKNRYREHKKTSMYRAR